MYVKMCALKILVQIDFCLEGTLKKDIFKTFMENSEL